ncbi:hypothetical protein [Pseudomonas vanderleydeniana]|uniref:Uncharacterized protein n=1 Tax=Pseudomonas vanderleydeniana TaxID=2745495 RepID=A0A9E6PFV8_9PSED|nr:hypothetical protein [Pseudomonas vanderleydeniana]QXI25668.1 hypothetical protein HU752_016960 [Pseudomonas vanderleydeniana]
MNVYVEKNAEYNRWWVYMDDWRVDFNTSTEAEQFVERLTTRLNAPHSFERLAGGSPYRGPADAGKARAGLAAQSDRQCAKEA